MNIFSAKEIFIILYLTISFPKIDQLSKYFSVRELSFSFVVNLTTKEKYHVIQKQNKTKKKIATCVNFRVKLCNNNNDSVLIIKKKCKLKKNKKK